MKKIAFISLNDHVPWGGSEVFWSELALLFLKEKSFKVGISTKFWTQSPSKVNELLQGGGIDFRRRENRKVMKFQRTFNIALPNKLKFDLYKSDFGILLNFEPDVAIISLGDHNQGSKWMEKCHDLGIPYILLTQLVKDASCLDERDIRYSRLKRGYINATEIWCPSFDNKDILEKQFATRLNNVTITNNPIDISEMRHPYPADTIRQIACVASLNYNHKGQDLLLQALSGKKWRNRPIQINFFGTGPHEQILKNLTKMWGIQNVQFHGHASVSDIWKKNEMLILPSRMEGLSLAFLEALSAERTAIVTKVGDAERFIEDNINGFLIKAPQAEFIDEALERAWEIRGKWKEMGKKARISLLNKIPQDPVKLMFDHLKKVYLN